MGLNRVQNPLRVVGAYNLIERLAIAKQSLMYIHNQVCYTT